ncbi:RDD family protein [Thermophagus sp. OGC60D27]|uniref:RDD family protein n=1 Tax=Thermophagus sp. OGC60D27 TaxID=3458415 RepID=UPI0040378A12
MLVSVFLIVFGLIEFFIWSVLLSLISPSTFAGFDPENRIFNYSIAFVFGMIYYSIIEFASGRTIAKYITKTKVVDQNGNHPGFQTIFVGSLCRFIPFEALSFWGGEDSGWHDRLSKTMVLNLKK